jgi:hypothetical protein
MAILSLQFRTPARGRQIAETLIIGLTSVKCLAVKGFGCLVKDGFGGVNWLMYPLWRLLYLGLALDKASGRGC